MKKYFMHVAIAIVIVLFLPYIVGFLNHNEYHKTANKIESIANGVYDLADILLNSFGVASKKNTIPNESISNSLNWAEQQDKPRMSAAQIKAQQDRQRKLEEQQALRDRINREKVESCITRVETQSDINKREMSNIDDYTFIGSSSTGWGFNIDGESFYIDLHK
jgi:hypothetical protein